MCARQPHFHGLASRGPGQVREPLKCIVSRANRVGMMYSPIAYGNPALFGLLAEGLRAEVEARAEAGAGAEAGASPAPGAPLSAGQAESLALLSAPPAAEVAAYEAMRTEPGWEPAKRLRVALFHFVYWSAFIDLYADWVFRVEDTTPAMVCARAPAPLPALCAAAQAEHRSPTTSSGGGAGGAGGGGGGIREVSDKTNSHEIEEDLAGTDWRALCGLSPTMAARAQALARRYGYSVAPEDACLP